MSYAEQLKELIDEDGEFPSDSGFEYVTELEIASGRWSRWDMVVVRAPDGSLLGYEKETGLTEYQEVEPVEEYEVFPVREVATVTYERVQPLTQG